MSAAQARMGKGLTTYNLSLRFSTHGVGMTKKVFIRTFGCQMNEYDSDKMVAVLADAEGTVRTDNPEDADIVLFAGVSGDTNPVHLDDEYAAGTPFKGRIAHGMLTAAFISAVLGTILPGPGAIYMSQSLRFKAPVRPGDTVRARARVTAIDPQRRRVTLETLCTVGGTIVVEGEALVMVPSRA